MTTILYTIAYFMFFFVFLQIEAPTCSKMKAAFLKNFLGTAQWKNINDVDFITYCGRKYDHNQIVGMDITIHSCNTNIRLAKLLLECSYANILKTIFTFIDYFQEHCKSLLNSEDKNDNAIHCTIELLDTISTSLCPLVILMKRALDTMNILRHEPWINSPMKSCILCKMTSSLSDESFLNFLSPSIIDLLNIESKLITIKKFFSTRRKELNVDMKFCHFKDHNNYTLDCETLKNEYDYLKTKEIEEAAIQEFYHFLKIKIENVAQWTVKNRYKALGFQCVLNTYGTFLLQDQKKPKGKKNSSEKKTQTLPHENLEEEMNRISSVDLPQIFPLENSEEGMNRISSVDLPQLLPQENSEDELIRTSSENLAHTLPHENFKEDIQILNNEYENLKTKENEKTTIQEFYHFLRIKIENEAQWTIKNSSHWTDFFQQYIKRSQIVL
ncbi:uncharacterized protein LOC126900970 isoform X2 [Daktulosphaira vitifoliae]|uniref:uncharacterized protein LOC126900970 isoform X2 n=1 Tax=Daktulosphaira vitifoliae TaxID=58002 RepID=UPI0021A9984C|nr:uncharacterized protein LOC126900970 isoform X2 [Daktulosphaira vitifoliae]XP_050532984.1 uncharacterized protein LOC126900970 isoform X2 [Daktulosphaira vitifoliae]XP_050532985.1 uncharacterized protein LOC126900970 isoform X2 [Daktulosphaira vitifoliae]